MSMVLMMGLQANRLHTQTNGAHTSSQDISDRIADVEAKLTAPVVIEGAEQVFHSLAEQMEFYGVPGVSIAVINEGRIEWAKGYGIRDAGTNLPVDENTIFQAASLSKPVSALGVLHWVSEGVLDLDANINDFLVSWKLPENEFTRTRSVTLRHLLSHTAGLAGQLMGAYSREEQIPTYVQMLEGMPPARTDPVRVEAVPQTVFRYAGAGYLIALQTTIDVVGRPYSDAVHEAVFEPVRMRRSGYHQPDEFSGFENVAAGHDGMGVVLEGRWQVMANLAGGGLWTTPSDLCLLAIEVQRALRGESSIITRELAEEMLTAQMGSYGLGFFIQGEGEDLAFSHGGDNQTFHNYLFAYAGRGQGVAIMTNGEKGSYLYPEILRAVGIVYDWSALKPSVIVPIGLSAEMASKYIGRYVFNEVLPVNLTHEDDHLRMLGDDGRVFLWYPDSENHFIDTITGWELEFVFDENDEVTAALLHIDATAMRGEKTDDRGPFSTDKVN
jgi:CubicO group peptidase (beta-lactamase class C family)